MAASALTPLQSLLLEEGRKQAWLARKLGVSPSEVNRWVRGLHVPEERTRRRIAQLLDRSVDELWPGTEVAA